MKKSSKPQKAVPATATQRGVRYKRAIRLIVELNEEIVNGTDSEDDPRWDRLAKLRKQLTADEADVIGRLVLSLTVGGKDIDIDEASPGSND